MPVITLERREIQAQVIIEELMTTLIIDDGFS